MKQAKTEKENNLIYALKIFALSASLIFASCGGQNKKTLPINFNHLKHLTQTICAKNDTFDIVHIYSEFPDYDWVDADKEGISCVDDVARAAVFYLRYFELSKDSTVLADARRLLNFVLKMQADDGDFYNFLLPDTTINRTGRTSKKKFDFWAARGYWAIGTAARIFHPIDPDFADSLQTAFLKCKFPLRKILENYPKTFTENGMEYPTWLINKYGADATAEFLLGVNQYLKQYRDAELLASARKLVRGIILMQLSEHFSGAGAFLSWKNVWHDWGNSQMQALAEFFEIGGDSTILEALKREANFLAKMLINGRIREFSLDGTSAEFPQIAYGIRCQAVGLIRLAEITGEIKYAQLAGLAASWLTGNNPAKTTMYDAKTGRTFDGINDANSVNKNSGAESTIEALLTILEISHNENAKNFVFAKPVQSNAEKIGKEIGALKREYILPTGEVIQLIFDETANSFEITHTSSSGN